MRLPTAAPKPQEVCTPSFTSGCGKGSRQGQGGAGGGMAAIMATQVTPGVGP